MASPAIPTDPASRPTYVRPDLFPTLRSRRALRSFALVLTLALSAALTPPAPARAAGETDDRHLSASERKAELSRFYDELKDAKTEMEGRRIENLIWQTWMIGPSPAISQMMQQALTARRVADYDKATAILDDVIARAPDYAEAWNQRATLRFLQGDLDGSLEDIDRVMELEPKHFAALSGRGLILLHQGRTRLAHKALREAVAINPWLRERSLLPATPDGDGPADKHDERDTGGRDI
ncbi:tetratricopeptide repeat protein [Afifella marina]|uniref:TPR repeat-containing protein n=1 Tax=Afifella marina DSM 2698 TaxID=1120955 RepID=A0A1G5MKT3_AFIMA|nr:tetratricopeptide repeat protein [Afifella marina]SCZ25139.1 TPR repeat-containing protein [Afifella marina DSM 2698]